MSAVAGLTLYVVLARRFARAGHRTWARATVATLVLVVGCTAAGGATADFRLVLLGDAIGWVWLTALFLDLHRTSEH